MSMFTKWTLYPFLLRMEFLKKVRSFLGRFVLVEDFPSEMPDRY